MNVISRGIRNAFRNSIRTFSIVVILGLSVGLALIMLVARQSVEQKITSVKSSIGNSITVSPAGARGFEGGGEPLTNDQLVKIQQIPNVSHVTATLSDRLTSETSNLVSTIDPGSLGKRQAGNSGIGFTGPSSDSTAQGQTTPSDNASGSRQFSRTFTPPVIITGTNDVTTPSVYGGSDVNFASGQAFDPTKGANEAVVGKTLAAKNNLNVGTTFTAYNTPIKVVGIYDAGSAFANAGLITSLSTLQRLSGQTNAITGATVIVSSIDNITTTTASLKSTLGSTADVTSQQDSAQQAVAPLQNVKSISLFSLVGALVAGAVVILLTMTMIVRERRREIGVMKAIGASNLKTTLQFISEAVTLTMLGMVAGVIVGIAGANPVTKALVNNSTSANSSQIAATPGQVSRGGAMGMRRGGFGGGVQNFGTSSLSNARTIRASVGWSILGYGAAAALLIAVIGSAVPAFLISKVRPAEVMRAE